jgi:hypothetical protein
MFKNFVIVIYFLFLNFYSANSQIKVQNEIRRHFSISLGYGVAGSFFVRSLPESLPFSTRDYTAFTKKRFLGSAQNFAIGYRLNKKYEIAAGINFQYFSRHVKATDTLQSVAIYLDKPISHRDYMYFGNVKRIFEKKKTILATGLGLYYLRTMDERIEYAAGRPNFFIDKEYNYQNSNEEEAGAFVEFSYEYKFQPRVNVGIKSQFYYTISTAEAESITLFPYIKMRL